MTSSNANPAGGDGGARQISDVQEHGEISQNCLAAQAELPVTIATWRRNARETIRVRIDTWQGRPVVDVRNWYTSDDGELRPSRSGITLSIPHLPQLAAAINQSLAEARLRGLLHEDGARHE